MLVPAAALHLHRPGSRDGVSILGTPALQHQPGGCSPRKRRCNDSFHLHEVPFKDASLANEDLFYIHANLNQTNVLASLLFINTLGSRQSRAAEAVSKLSSGVHAMATIQSVGLYSNQSSAQATISIYGSVLQPGPDQAAHPHSHSIEFQQAIKRFTESLGKAGDRPPQSTGARSAKASC